MNKNNVNFWDQGTAQKQATTIVVSMVIARRSGHIMKGECLDRRCNAFDSPQSDQMV